MILVIAAQQSTWHYGPSWDESHPNFPVALQQAEWIRGVLTFSLPDAFAGDTIYEYWYTESDHPSLPKTLMAVSWLVLRPLGLEDAAALRFPAAVYFALMGWILFAWSRREWGLAAAWFALLAWTLSPRLFAHGHIASLDLPMAFAWLLVAWVYFSAGNTWRAAILAGLVYAFALNIKLHAFFLPVPLILWSLYRRQWGDWKKGAAMAVLGLVLYFVVQPYLWFDTAARIHERFFDLAVKTTRAPILIYYFGERYANNTPWHYPLVMTLLTLPGAVAVFLLAGTGLAAMKRAPVLVYWLLHAAVPLSLVLLPLAQGYDGIRLWLPAFPFFVLLAGYGFQRTWEAIGAAAPRLRQPAALAAVLVLLFLPLALNLARLHPCQLSYYNEFIGGPAGARSAGMETTYWCEAVNREVVDAVNRVVPPNGKLRPMAMNYAVWEWYRQRGILREDIIYEEKEPFDAYVLQYRQGFFGPQEALLTTRTPLARWSCAGVPVVDLYGDENWIWNYR